MTFRLRHSRVSDGPTYRNLAEVARCKIVAPRTAAKLAAGDREHGGAKSVEINDFEIVGNGGRFFQHA